MREIIRYRWLALSLLVVLLLLVWGNAQHERVSVETATREAEDRAVRERIAETEKRLEERIRQALWHGRMAQAYAVEMYALAKAAGMSPPPPPKEFLDGDPPGSPERDPQR